MKKWFLSALAALFLLSACSKSVAVKKEVKPDIGPAKDRVAEYMDALQAGDLEKVELIHKDKLYEPVMFLEGLRIGVTGGLK